MSCITNSELDSILILFGNQTRRRIVKKLTQEPSYPSRLSKELGLGQALVAKHLEAMEDVGVVRSSVESSPCGPKRREYLLSKSMSVTLDFAPHFFNAQILSFGTALDNREISADASSLVGRIDRIMKHSGTSGKLGLLAALLADVDGKLRELQEERTVLLYVRNHAMKEVNKLIREAEKTTDEKRVLYHILDGHDESVQSVSESLNLRESVVRKVLAELENDL